MLCPLELIKVLWSGKSGALFVMLRRCSESVILECVQFRWCELRGSHVRECITPVQMLNTWRNPWSYRTFRTQNCHFLWDVAASLTARERRQAVDPARPSAWLASDIWAIFSCRRWAVMGVEEKRDVYSQVHLKKSWNYQVGFLWFFSSKRCYKR